MTPDGKARRLPLYLTPDRPCAYLPGREERVLFVDPHAPMSGPAYESLLARGYRRAGRFIYRPACGQCQACVPVRLAVHHFTPSRSQRRSSIRSAPVVLTVSIAPIVSISALVWLPT